MREVRRLGGGPQFANHRIEEPATSRGPNPSITQGCGSVSPMNISIQAQNERRRVSARRTSSETTLREVLLHLNATAAGDFCRGRISKRNLRPSSDVVSSDAYGPTGVRAFLSAFPRHRGDERLVEPGCPLVDYRRTRLAQKYSLRQSPNGRRSLRARESKPNHRPRTLRIQKVNTACSHRPNQSIDATRAPNSGRAHPRSRAGSGSRPKQLRPPLRHGVWFGGR